MVRYWPDFHRRHLASLAGAPWLLLLPSSPRPTPGRRPAAWTRPARTPRGPLPAAPSRLACVAPAASRKGCRPHPRHVQVDRSHPCVPLAFPVAVALVRALRVALITFGADVLRHLDIHQLLGQHADAVSQEIDVLNHLGLVQAAPRRPSSRRRPSCRFSPWFDLLSFREPERWPSFVTAPGSNYTNKGTARRRWRGRGYPSANPRSILFL